MRNNFTRLVSLPIVLCCRFISIGREAFTGVKNSVQDGEFRLAVKILWLSVLSIAIITLAEIIAVFDHSPAAEEYKSTINKNLGK